VPMSVGPLPLPTTRPSIAAFNVILPTLTVKPTFGQLIVHGVKPTQVQRTGTLTRRCGDHVTLCISRDNHTNKHRNGLQCRTKWSANLSVLSAQARRALDTCVPQCPCRTVGHVVAIVLLGSTRIVSRSEWTKSVPLQQQMLCTVNLSTVFVTEIVRVWSLQDTHPSIPNVMVRLLDFPGHKLPHDVVDSVLARQHEYIAQRQETVRIKKLKLK
jgi:hypothetical protein